jgi:predicted nucleic acid-binding protein
MIDFVIDANVLMSILMSGKASYRLLLTNYKFIVPEYALWEVNTYQDTIKQKTKMQDEEFENWTYFVFSNIIVLPEYVLRAEYLEKATSLVEKIDVKDVNYVALAMQLDLVLLTRDKPIHTGLRKQGYKRILLYDDFLKNLP